MGLSIDSTGSGSIGISHRDLAIAGDSSSTFIEDTSASIGSGVDDYFTGIYGAAASSNIAYIDDSSSGAAILVFEPRGTSLATVLDNIRSRLGMSITDLANIMDASRKTIYNWKKNDRVGNSTKLKKIFALDRIAQEVEDSGLRLPSRCIDIPTSSGLTLRHLFQDSAPNVDKALFIAAKIALQNQDKKESNLA